MGTDRTLRLTIDDGTVSFDVSTIDDDNLRTWLEDCDPSDLMEGMWTVDVDVTIAGWDDDGPAIVPRIDDPFMCDSCQVTFEYDSLAYVVVYPLTMIDPKKDE